MSSRRSVLCSTGIELEAVKYLARGDFSEALSSVAHVFRDEGLRRYLHRQQIRSTDAVGDSGVDERLGVAVGDRRTGGELADVGPRLRLDVGVREDLVDEAPGVERFRIIDVGGEHHLLRASS